MADNTVDISLRKAAIAAGLGFLLVILAGPFAFVVESELAIDRGAAATANNIMSNELLFRLAVIAFMVVIAGDVIIAWGLYAFLKPVNRSVSLLGGWLRLLHAAIFAAGLIFLFLVLRLLSSNDYLAAFTPEQLHVLVLLFFKAFHDGYLIGQAFFSLHLLMIGYLSYRSGYVPRLLGIFLMVGGPLGYFIDSFTNLLFPSIAVLAYPGLVVGTIAELWLCIWLLVKGGKKQAVAAVNE